MLVRDKVYGATDNFRKTVHAKADEHVAKLQGCCLVGSNHFLNRTSKGMTVDLLLCLDNQHG